ncbi:hypothetical protein [Pedobacter alpinus]|uniref:Uncharacterized protein n=1 Tax=Pedobacter alpinus TaxID=1590643 RepID=A0ABW5TVD1_9SPHI
MNISFTNHTLEKVELLLKELGFKVRYEKGNFKTGSCLIENSKIVMVNKFSNLESKILSLVELLKTIDADETKLSEKQKSFYYAIKQTTLAI